MKAPLTLALVVVVALYPLLVYWGLGRWEPRWLALALLVVVLPRLALLRGVSRQQILRLLPLAGAVLFTAVLVGLTNSRTLLLLNPAIVSALWLAAFAWTLWHPPPMVERFARLSDPVLPPGAIRYCRRVTQVWCGFFIFNATVALWTALQTSVGEPLRLWTLYNGLLAYLLMGALGLGEYLVRRVRKAAFARELAALEQAPE